MDGRDVTGMIGKVLPGADLLRCATLSGESRQSLHVVSTGPFGKSTVKPVSFEIPKGYRRLGFSKRIEATGVRGGGSVDWVSLDPGDGQIELHGFVEGFSAVEVEVSDVLAIRSAD